MHVQLLFLRRYVNHTFVKTIFGSNLHVYDIIMTPIIIEATLSQSLTLQTGRGSWGADREGWERMREQWCRLGEISGREKESWNGSML